MSIRDILHDRNLRRQHDSGKQKDGYKYMLQFIAKRRKEIKDYDVQQEEIKLLNGIKMHVDSGWVLDRSTLTQLFTITGVDDISEEYQEAVRAEDIQLPARIVPILQFAYKVACNMGLPDLLPLDQVILPPADPLEV